MNETPKPAVMYALIDQLTGEPKARFLGLFHCERVKDGVFPDLFGRAIEHVEDRLRHGVIQCVYVNVAGRMITMRIGRMQRCPGAK